MKKVILSESQLKHIVNAVNENQFDETGLKKFNIFVVNKNHSLFRNLV